jgi:23S rRNA pseudouridine955/2504/2580 synthase
LDDNVNNVQYFYITAEESGQRLDNFLIRKLKGVPKSFIYRIIRDGQVRVNKKRAKALNRLEEGDAVRVPPLRMKEVSERKLSKQSLKSYEWIEEMILYEDDAFLVLNKPSGLAVHGGSGVNLGIIEILRILRPHCTSLELGHRLDRETSGCLLIAKKRSFLRVFHQLLREKQVEKEYMTLLAGKWGGKKVREVNLPLLKNVTLSGERVVKVTDEGKPSKTIFELMKNFEAACWVKASPLTGRTHQIRVHAAQIGHPVLGDEKYGKEHFKKSPRLCLHARALKFTLPEDRGTCYFEAPIDEKLKNFLTFLESEKEHE